MTLNRTVRAGAAVLTASLLTAAAPAGGAAMALHGDGVQIYVCAATGSAVAWRLKAPEATLRDADGRVVGRHFAGPSWQAADGSIVVGEVAVSSPGEAGAVPWLVLRAKSHAGSGTFAAVAYVVRSETVGGVAPATGCDREHLGAQVRVGYRAIYTFFPKQDVAKP